MKLAKSALLASLTMLALFFTMSAQTLRLDSDPRNTAPTVGTGGPVGGPTGLFTVYDGQTLRKGEYTFSAAYSNFDRDPGNADFTEVPVSFQIGINDHLELFFNTDAYRGIKVNSPRNLSAFYLPNSQLRNGATFSSGGAIVLGNTAQTANSAVFRFVGAQPFVQFPYVGGSGGTLFPFATTLGTPRAGGGADLFPGIGSTFGGILPGVVLQVACGQPNNVCTNNNQFSAATSTIAPTYLPDAPFLNRQYGQSAFSTFSAGAKWRWTAPTNPIGVGVLAYYRWYADTASDASGFNQLQRGASPGGSRGDVGAVLFADARVRQWMNLSANIGYNYNSSIKGQFPSGTFTLLDRPDEVIAAVAADFPVNKYFQPILEFRTTQYVGGRTPNAFENSPVEALAGARWYPTRWMSFGAAYRYHANQQDRDSLKDDKLNTTTIIGGRQVSVVNGGIPVGFQTSTDPHGFVGQITIGRRNSRDTTAPSTVKPNSDVTELNIDSKVVYLPCPAGTKSNTRECSDDNSVAVNTKATNPDNDTLLYNYTVSGGRIVGSGSSVNWDLTGAKAGTYTITSAVDNGCGFCGKTKTETIEVKECAGCTVPCNCPTLSVSGPGAEVSANDMMTFTANTSGGSVDGVTYNWTVSSGSIAEGQGTPVIKVSGAAGTNVTATVEIGGNGLCPDCVKTASDSGSFGSVPTSRKVDEQGKAPDDDVKARLQNIRDSELQNDPTATLYIINRGSAKEKAVRVKQLNKAIAFLQIDSSRVKIVDGGAAPELVSEYYIVPAGAADPM